MKIKLYYFAFLLLAPSFLKGQAPGWLWANAFGDTGSDYVNSIDSDPFGSGDVYTAGYYQGTVDFDPGEPVVSHTYNGGFDMFVSKSDAAGNLEWVISLGGPANDFPRDIQVDPGGNGIYVTGYYIGSFDFDPGDEELVLTSNGGWDGYVMKLDEEGNLIWAKSFGGPFDEFPRTLGLDPAGSGDVIVGGSFQNTVDFDPGVGVEDHTSAGDQDFFMLKLNSAGEFQWAKTAGGTARESINAIAVDIDGSIYLTGGYGSTVDFDPGSGTANLTTKIERAAYVSKSDREGNLIWVRPFDGAEYMQPLSLSVDPSGSGDVITSGYFIGTFDFDPGAEELLITPQAFRDGYVTKLDNDGNLAWAKTIGGFSWDEVSAVAYDPGGSGDVYLTGYFELNVDMDPGMAVHNFTSFNSSSDIFVSMLNSNGDLVWAKQVIGEKLDNTLAIHIDADRHLYLGGYFYSSMLQFDTDTVVNPFSSNTTIEAFFAKLDESFPTVVLDNGELHLSIYPNPASSEVNITTGELTSPKNIHLWNSKGQLIMSMDQISGVINQFDVSKLTTGFYFIEVVQNGIRTVRKIFIQ